MDLNTRIQDAARKKEQLLKERKMENRISRLEKQIKRLKKKIKKK